MRRLRRNDRTDVGAKWQVVLRWFRLRTDHLMNRVLLPNFFFEEELQSTAKLGSASARQLAGELGPLIGLLAGEKSAADSESHYPSQTRSIVVISEDARPDEVPPALQGVEFLTIDEIAVSKEHESQSDSETATVWEAVPWGWSESAVAVLRKAGLCVSAPDIDVVRLINSRQFQSQFDAAIDIDGVERVDSFGTLCRTLREVKAAIEAACEYSQRGWVIKADLSHASRNRLLGASSVLRSEHRAWIESRFASGESVYVEPWVERISECGLQFFVPQAGTASATIQFVGAAEMLTDETGHYRGSIVRSVIHDAVWQPAIDHCLQIARSAATQGYFGPLGFDCMVFRCPKHGRRWLRLSHDINGRLTMGRVALSLRKFLEPGETGIWVHTAANSGLHNSMLEKGNRTDEASSGSVRIIPTSPGRIGGGPSRNRTALVASADSDQLKATCTQILGQSVKKMPASGIDRHS